MWKKIIFSLSILCVLFVIVGCKNESINNNACFNIKDSNYNPLSNVVINYYDLNQTACTSSPSNQNGVVEIPIDGNNYILVSFTYKEQTYLTHGYYFEKRKYTIIFDAEKGVQIFPK